MSSVSRLEGTYAYQTGSLLVGRKYNTTTNPIIAGNYLRKGKRAIPLTKLIKLTPEQSREVLELDSEIKRLEQLKQIVLGSVFDASK